MKQIIAIVISIILCSPSWAAIAFIQSRGVDGGSVTSAPLAFNSTTTAGSLVVVGVRIGANGRTITVSDAQGNTYSQAGTTIDDAQGDDNAIFYAPNIVGGTTDTVTIAISGAAATIRFAIHEYSGAATTSPLDQTAGQAYATTTTPDSGNVTTTQDNELLFGWLVDGNTVADITSAGTGYNLREKLIVSVLKFGSEDKLSTTAGVYSAGFTLTGVGFGAIRIATFKVAAAGGVAAGSNKMNKLQVLED